MKKIILITAVILMSLLGGFLGSLFLPSLVSRVPFLSGLDLINSGGQRITIINQEPKEIIVDKADAVARAVEKVKPAIAVLERQRKSRIISSSSAVAITSDGWFLAPSSMAQGITSPADQDNFVLSMRGEDVPVEFVKSDPARKLAIFSVKNRNFYTPEFAALDKLSLGDTVFLLAALEDETLENSFESGYISRLTQSGIDFSPGFGMTSVNGGAVFTTEGKLLALSVRSGENIFFAPISDINYLLAEARK